MDKFEAFPLWIKIIFGFAIIIHTILFYGSYKLLNNKFKSKVNTKEPH